MGGGYNDEGRRIGCYCIRKVHLVVTGKDGFLLYVATRNRTELYMVEKLRSLNELSIRRE